jgi:CelD/BcsL family acetyltransferase involved in cellulose biosynthesis
LQKNFNEFELHLRAILSLPIFEIKLENLMATKTAQKEAALQKLAADLKLPQEHLTSLGSIQDYFDKHRINELFNELMTNILQERPVDARQYLLDSLKSL